jgi:hypothetical protein
MAVATSHVFSRFSVRCAQDMAMHRRTSSRRRCSLSMNTWPKGDPVWVVPAGNIKGIADLDCPYSCLRLNSQRARTHDLMCRQILLASESSLASSSVRREGCMDMAIARSRSSWPVLGFSLRSAAVA